MDDYYPQYNSQLEAQARQLFKRRSLQQARQMDAQYGQVLPDPANEVETTQFIDQYVEMLLHPGNGMSGVNMTQAQQHSQQQQQYGMILDGVGNLQSMGGGGGGPGVGSGPGLMEGMNYQNPGQYLQQQYYQHGQLNLYGDQNRMQDINIHSPREISQQQQQHQQQQQQLMGEQYGTKDVGMLSPQVVLDSPQRMDMDILSTSDHQQQQQQQSQQYQQQQQQQQQQPLYPTEAVREKNRKAQKRFRERQKAKMHGLEDSVLAMKKELTQLRKEVQTLKSSNTMFQKILKLKEEQIHLLQESAKIFQESSGGGTSSTSSPYQQTQQDQQESQLVKDEQNVMSREFTRSGSLTDKQAREAKAKDLIMSWKSYVKHISGKMIEMEEGNDDPELQKKVLSEVESLMQEACDMCLRTAITQPLRIKRLIMCNLEDTETHGVTTDDLARSCQWKSIVDSLLLSQEQIDTIINLRESFLDHLRYILDDRREINKRLTVAMPVKQENRFISMAGLQVAECISDLKENLRKEHQEHLDFMAAVLKNTLTLKQLATASVCSYPYFPDALAIANHLANEVESEDDEEIQAP